MKDLYQPSHTARLAFVRWSLLAALLLLFPAVIYTVARAGFSGYPLQAPNAPDADVDLSLGMAISPGPYYSGENITFTLSVNNLGPGLASSAVLTDTLPAGMSLVSAIPSSGACSGTSPIVCDLPAVPTDTTDTITIAAFTNLTGSFSNNGIITTTIGDTDLDPSNNTRQVPLVVNPSADLSAALQAAPGTVIAGQPLTYTVAINNSGPSISPDVNVIDTLPAGVTLLSAVPSQGGCTGQGPVSCSLGGLDAGASASILLRVAVQAGARGTLSNTATVSGPDHDPLPVNNTDQVDTPITAQSDLAAALPDFPGTVIAGQPFSYTVEINNSGPSTSQSVVVTDTLPVGVTLRSAAASQGSCATQDPVICSLGSIAPGASANIVIDVSVPADAQGVLTNSVTVSGPDEDPVPGNNTDLASATITSHADLTITLTDLFDPINAGSDQTYHMTVSNAGPSAARQVTIVNIFPAQVSYVSSTPGCAANGNTLTCTQAVLEPGGTLLVTLDVSAKASASGIITDTAHVSSEASDPNPGDNQASTTTTVNPAPPQDSTPPTLAWTSPVTSNTYGAIYAPFIDKVLLSVNASDDSGVASVEFYRWDAVAEKFVSITGLINKAPYSVSIHTNSLNQGWNQVFAVAYDSYGNQKSLWIWIVRHSILLPLISHP